MSKESKAYIQFILGLWMILLGVGAVISGVNYLKDDGIAGVVAGIVLIPSGVFFVKEGLDY